MNIQSIASSGMNAAALRLEAAASNIANAQSEGALHPPTGAPVPTGTQSPDLKPVYEPRHVDQVSLSAGAAGGVSASIKTTPDYYAAYKPDASYADAQGMVAVPKVDLAEQTVERITAQQSFQSNMSVYKTADAMQKALLDIKT